MPGNHPDAAARSSPAQLAQQATIENSSGESLRQLEDALQMLPFSDKEAYLEAQKFAPMVVQTESDPMKFLMYENFNAWASAQLLASYWRIRKRIFGPKDFLKPIHLTGEGALKEEDIAILDTGSLCVLPKIGQTGQSVLWWDREKLDPKQILLQAQRLRVFFYILQVLMDEEENYKGKKIEASDESCASMEKNDKGLVVLALLSTSLGGGSSDFDFARKVLEIGTAMPIHITAIHLVSVPNERSSGIMKGIASIALKMMGSFFGKFARIHIGNSMRELQQKLRAAGFDKRGLPAKIGGSWKDDKFEQFKRKRRKIEEDMFLTEEERLARKRKVNMIHSRQKRERRKIELEVLQDQCKVLTDQKNSLIEEQKRLEALLVEAEQVVENAKKRPKDNAFIRATESEQMKASFRSSTDATQEVQGNSKSPLHPSGFPHQHPQQHLTQHVENQQVGGNIDFIRMLAAQNLQQRQQQQQQQQQFQRQQEQMSIKSLQLQQLLSSQSRLTGSDLNLEMQQRQLMQSLPEMTAAFPSGHVMSSNEQQLRALAATMQNGASSVIPTGDVALGMSTSQMHQQMMLRGNFHLQQQYLQSNMTNLAQFGGNFQSNSIPQQSLQGNFTNMGGSSAPFFNFNTSEDAAKKSKTRSPPPRNRN